MANASHETVIYPFTAFNFAVEITRSGGGGAMVSAAFSDCDGLELTREPRTIREGGNNGQVIRLSGPVGYGTLTLKRGMTASFDLWTWFEQTVQDPALRADAEVVLLGANGSDVRARFLATRCLPVRLKAPTLNARDGAVAVEELQLAYETLSIKPGDA
jgi:phage tail-like protein